MKRQFVATTIGMGIAAFACNAAFAADQMSPGARTTDMRVKCEQMTGNDRLECLDRVKARDSTVGGAPTTRGRSHITTEQARSEGRNAVNDPNQRCDDLTGNDRLACNDQLKQRDSTRGGGVMNPTGSPDPRAISMEQARSEGRNAVNDPQQRCDDLTGNDRLACNDQIKSTNAPRR
jgi:hypothetical protein